VWPEILAIGAVAEPARVQTGGDGLNSGEFSYRQELLPHPTGRENTRFDPPNYEDLMKIGKMSGFCVLSTSFFTVD
jgi:hypothetical protein